jgi:GDP/UDP-N,N'-diacetylbacillosamine 2-epimerase (hydrolysing)
MTAYKICAITGSRAEFGLLTPLLSALRNDPCFDLQILVTGMHLSPEFGDTYKEIESHGFIINEKVYMLLSSDTDTAIVKSIGVGMIGYADAFDRLKPDWTVILGDRFEVFAAATAAYMKKIPIAHLHGGEVTAGATDEALRHSITKMSSLHFTSTEEYRKRVLQLGEDNDCVFNVGAIGLDNIQNLSLLGKKELEKALNISLNGELVLVTFHPVTLDTFSSEDQMKELLDALTSFERGQIIFTMPNADAGGRIIRTMIKQYVSDHVMTATAFDSLGQVKYLSLMQHSSVIVGNSSSGIIEAPGFGKPSINIGDRQKGRIAADSVIQCEPVKISIVNALNKAFDARFKEFCTHVQNPYGKGQTTEKIISILKRHMTGVNLKKQFVDRL